MKLARSSFLLVLLAAGAISVASLRLYIELRYSALTEVATTVLNKSGTKNTPVLQGIYDNLNLDEAQFFCLPDFMRRRSELAMAIYLSRVREEADGFRDNSRHTRKLKQRALRSVQAQLYCSPQQGGALLQYAFLSVDRPQDVLKGRERKMLLKSYEYAPREDWVIRMRFPLVSHLLEVEEDQEFRGLNRGDMDAILYSGLPPFSGIGFLIEMFGKTTRRYQIEMANSFSKLSPEQLQWCYQTYKSYNDYFGLTLLFNAFPDDMKLHFRLDLEMFPYRFQVKQ